jgi:hypothetical protein
LLRKIVLTSRFGMRATDMKSVRGISSVFPPEYCQEVCLRSAFCAFSVKGSFCLPTTKKCFGLFVDYLMRLHYQPLEPVCYDPRCVPVICG